MLLHLTGYKDQSKKRNNAGYRKCLNGFYQNNDAVLRKSIVCLGLGRVLEGCKYYEKCLANRKAELGKRAELKSSKG